MNFYKNLFVCSNFLHAPHPSLSKRTGAGCGGDATWRLRVKNCPFRLVWVSFIGMHKLTTMYFDKTKPGGKALMETLTATLLITGNMDYQAAGCDIAKVYLKRM